MWGDDEGDGWAGTLWGEQRCASEFNVRDCGHLWAWNCGAEEVEVDTALKCAARQADRLNMLWLGPWARHGQYSALAGLVLS